MSGTMEKPVDLTSCDKEPIRVPGRIQSHGALLAMDRDGVVRQASENLQAIFGLAADKAVGRKLSELFPGDAGAHLWEQLLRPAAVDNPYRLSTITNLTDPAGARLELIGHRRGENVILELEPTPGDAGPVADASSEVASLLSRLRSSTSLAALTDIIAREIRRITGFDRVLVYNFDPDGHGVVIAEDRNEKFSTLMHHRFPAEDIPAQARELYRLSLLRLIPDADRPTAKLVPEMNPVTGQPLDLSIATLRAVSPIHIEYMKNMGTLSSMSISILSGDKLWGLISCHNRAPRHVGFAARQACDFIGRVLSLQLPAYESTTEIRRRIELKSLQAGLLATMAAEDNMVDGLRKRTDDLLRLAGADGAAILFNDECILVGQTPDEDAVRRIADFLGEHAEKGVYATDQLAAVHPDAAVYRATASGALAISISQLYRSYILWFRPEVVRTIEWAGEPGKMVPDPQGRIHPRKSFETWRETVRQKSRPWDSAEIEAVSEFRTGVVNVVLRKAEELAQLSSQLRQTNQELETFSYSVSHDLRAPFRHIVGYGNLLSEEESKNLSDSGRRYLATILESAEYAGTLVDNLLSLSRIGRTALQFSPVDLEAVARQVQRDFARDVADRKVDWKITPLPKINGDLVLLRVVLQNLIGNAIKFTKNQPNPRIEIGAVDRDGEDIIFVRDNGVGFDMQYVDKLFGVFQRLHTVEEYEGTGIGLATVRRIISRHGGRVWAEGQPGQGATFFFTLPKPYVMRETNA